MIYEKANTQTILDTMLGKNNNTINMPEPITFLYSAKETKRDNGIAIITFIVHNNNEFFKDMLNKCPEVNIPLITVLKFSKPTHVVCCVIAS